MIIQVVYHYEDHLIDYVHANVVQQKQVDFLTNLFVEKIEVQVGKNHQDDEKRDIKVIIVEAFKNLVHIIKDHVSINPYPISKPYGKDEKKI